MNNIQNHLDYSDAIADWFLDMSEAHNLRGDFTTGLKYTFIAANILCRQNRTLSSVRVESNLQFVANSLRDCISSADVNTTKTAKKEVCLHVLSEALSMGGMISMVTRWMKNDQSGRIHSVALLSKPVPIPDELLHAVSQTGGSIFTANSDDSILLKAVWLKSLANDLASHIVLHIDVSDVICGAAFGKNGGPPVLLINYNAHIFWTGASIADLVVNIRGSALEEFWTATYRGISKYATIPIPLLEKTPTITIEKTSKVELKNQAKKSLDIPIDSIVMLTVGASFKYLPIDNLDFVEVCECILKELPDAYILAVGFDADSRWISASSRVGSRIRALGTLSQSKLAIIQQATDIYIEGFPFGTTTSLLEAGIQGTPVVLAPAVCPPPYGSDGVALDDTLERPGTLEEYKDKIIYLSMNPAERELLGDNLYRAVTKHHIGAGWSQYLENAISALPQEHLIQPLIKPTRTPKAIHEYWSKYVTKWAFGYEESLEYGIRSALSMGLRPRLTKTVLIACNDYDPVRAHRTIPVPLLRFLCNFVFPVLPTLWARNIFIFFSFLCRASLLSRMHDKVNRLLGRTNARQSWYSEYRN